MDRKQIKQNAKDGMHFRYWPIVGIELIAGVLTGGGFSIGSSFSNNSSNWQQASNNEYAAGIMSILAVIGAIAAAVGIVYMILFGNVISVGQSGVRLAAYRKQEFAIKDLFKGLKRYGRIVGTMALYTLFVMLGFFCFIVPGIIVAYGLFEVPYLLSEDESLSGMAAIRRSSASSRSMPDKSAASTAPPSRRS